jgi:hypothetical protein
LLGGEQDLLEQPIDIALAGKRGANLVELFEAAEKVFLGSHGPSLFVTSGSISTLARDVTLGRHALRMESTQNPGIEPV